MAIFGSDDRTPSHFPNVLQGKGSKGNFTGFLVSNDLVLTVKHALPDRGFSFETPEVARFLNLENHSHFYTSDEETIRDLASSDRFVQERSSVLDNGAADVHVLYAHPTNSFFYMSSKREADAIMRDLKHYEIVESGAFGVEDGTVHRLYNPINGAHFFTESTFEATHIEEHLGFVNEGFL